MRTPLGEVPDHLLRHMTMAEAYEYLQARRRRPTRRSFLTGALSASAMAAAGPVLWRRPARADVVPPAALHLAHGTDPTSQVVVGWRSPVGAEPVFLFGPATGELARAESPIEGTVAGVDGLVYYKAKLDHLAPATTYTYQIAHGYKATRTGSFTTASPTASGFRFATLGDMGATTAGTEITNRILGAEVDLVFFVGDLCYADRLGGAAELLYDTGPLPGHQDLTAWDAWLAQIEPSVSATPWMFTTGNHEMEVGQGKQGYDGFLTRMHVPLTSGHPYYSFRYQNAAFVALDANDVSYEITHNRGYTGPAQDTWLVDTLAALRRDPRVDFIVVGFHHCMYCSNVVHGSDGGPREHWADLFDQHQVDLVVNGHNHSYERTHPVLGGAPTRDDTGYTRRNGFDQSPVIPTGPGGEGVVYATAGGGGQQSYPSSLHPVSYVTNEQGLRVPEEAGWSAARYLGDHSALIVDVSPRRGSEPPTMRCEAQAADSGEGGGPLIVDRFTLVAGS